MRKQDFKKLAKYTAEKLVSVYDIESLVAGRITMKNDPMECFLHICDENDTWECVFWEQDDYQNAKFTIDHIFKTVKDSHMT